MDILFVVPYVPSKVRVRPYHLIRQLLRAGHRVTVLTLWVTEDERAEAQELAAQGVEVLAYPMPKTRSMINCLTALPSRKPLQTVYSWNPHLANDLLRLVRERMKDSNQLVVHVEHLRGVQYGLYLQRQLKNARIPVIWDSVDSISLLFRLASRRSRGFLRKVMTGFELGRTEGYESRLPGLFQRVLVTSPKDRDEFLRLGGESGIKNRIEVLPNGVDLDYFSPGDSSRKVKNELVLTGKMSYHANITMALHLVGDIMPLVWKKQPDVSLVLAGKDPPREILALAEDPRIKVTGSVRDLRPYIQSAAASAAPIVYGVGIQNKILESMACATPVVTTPAAVSALSAEPGRDILVAGTPQSFADALLCLLSDGDLREKIGFAGRQYVEEHHRWEKLAGSLIQVYNEEIEKISERE